MYADDNDLKGIDFYGGRNPARRSFTIEKNRKHSDIILSPVNGRNLKFGDEFELDNVKNTS